MGRRSPSHVPADGIRVVRQHPVRIFPVLLPCCPARSGAVPVLPDPPAPPGLRLPVRGLSVSGQAVQQHRRPRGAPVDFLAFVLRPPCGSENGFGKAVRETVSVLLSLRFPLAFHVPLRAGHSRPAAPDDPFLRRQRSRDGRFRPARHRAPAGRRAGLESRIGGTAEKTEFPGREIPEHRAFLLLLLPVHPDPLYDDLPSPLRRCACRMPSSRC